MACSSYIAESLGREGHFDLAIEYGTTRISPIVRHFAPICYLCGAAPSEHADHVNPRELDGPDTWSNLGGVCAHCNYVKGPRKIELTGAQRERLERQKTAIRQAFEELLQNPLDFWAAYFEFEIEDAVALLEEEHIEDPQYVDREVVSYAMGIDTIQVEYPLIPDEAIQGACDEVIRRLRDIA